MQQNKALFFGIIGLAVLIVAALIAARFFLADQIELPTLAEKVSIRVVAAPSIEPWARQAASAFNQKNPNTQVEIVRANGLIPDAQFRADPQNPPAAWLAEATFMVELAGHRGLAFQDAQSVASSGLTWGAFKTKQDEFNQNYGGLSWEGLHAKAVSPEDGLNFVVASPANSAEGLAALISAAAATLKKDSLSGSDVSQADAWLTELFEINAKTPATPADNFATMRVSAGDAGLLSLASWRRARLTENPDFTTSPAQPPVNLDYPLAIFSQASPAAQQAATAFRTFLLDAGQQNSLNTVFLDPASTASSGVQADGDAVQRLLDLAGRVLQ
ncbi:MAG: solute-binding protein [Anaerolineales bacterium]|nr:solute-binding protein [Anaerolineales bacterium]